MDGQDGFLVLLFSVVVFVIVFLFVVSGIPCAISDAFCPQQEWYIYQVMTVGEKEAYDRGAQEIAQGHPIANNTLPMILVVDDPKMIEEMIKRLNQAVEPDQDNR